MSSNSRNCSKPLARRVEELWLGGINSTLLVGWKDFGQEYIANISVFLLFCTFGSVLMTVVVQMNEWSQCKTKICPVCKDTDCNASQFHPGAKPQMDSFGSGRQCLYLHRECHKLHESCGKQKDPPFQHIAKTTRRSKVVPVT